MIWILRVSLITLLALTAMPVPAQSPGALRKLLQQIHFDQHLNAQMPINTRLVDEQGRTVSLGRYLGQRPMILVLGYYHCKHLCDVVLKGLVNSLNQISFRAGRDFEIVSVSIDPRDTPAAAMKRKQEALTRYNKSSGGGWHMLVGEDDSIHKIASAAGFGYAYDPAQDEYLHAAGILVLTPTGRISRYLYGVKYQPLDLRLALVEASANRIGSPVDQLLLRCCHYDPTTGRYSLTVIVILRWAGSALVLAIVAYVLLMLWRERRAVRPAATS